MDCDFTEEHALLRQSIKKFTSVEIIPRARELGAKTEIPRDLWKKICRFGLLEMVAPGLERDVASDSITLGIAAEELGKGDVSLAATLIPNLYFCLMLHHAADVVKGTWLDPIIKGQTLSCVALTESHCGTDTAAIETTAVRKGNEYVLNGEKVSVGWALAADVTIVFAKTDAGDVDKGISSFILPLNQRGVHRSISTDMGLKGIGRGSIVMEDVTIPAANRVGVEGAGLGLMKDGFNLMRVLVALISLGTAETVLGQTIEYVKHRRAFGRPIGRFEGVSFKIAEAATRIEAGRALCYRTLWLRDRGRRHTKESAMCKWWVTKAAVDIIHDALIIHGHFGYSVEAMIEQRLRDVIGNQLVDGSPEAMKMTIVHELMGKTFLPFHED